MNLLDIYNLLSTKEITEAQAATAFGVTSQNLKTRIRMWGHRLPLLLATLDKIKAETMTRQEASATLNVTARQINKLQESWKVERPLKTYLVDRATTEIKWEIRKKYAIDYVSGSVEIDEAADRAGVSSRQMRRWVSDMLKKHFEMQWADLKYVSPIKRKRLADEMDKAENLEIDKLATLKMIASGRLDIENEAIRRVMSKRVVHDRRSQNG